MTFLMSKEDRYDSTFSNTCDVMLVDMDHSDMVAVGIHFCHPLTSGSRSTEDRNSDVIQSLMSGSRSTGDGNSDVIQSLMSGCRSTEDGNSDVIQSLMSGCRSTEDGNSDVIQSNLASSNSDVKMHVGKRNECMVTSLTCSGISPSVVCVCGDTQNTREKNSLPDNDSSSRSRVMLVQGNVLSPLPTSTVVTSTLQSTSTVVTSTLQSTSTVVTSTLQSTTGVNMSTVQSTSTVVTSTSKGSVTGGKRGKGGKPSGLTADNNQLPPCRVCGAAASGFHYGVNTCEACKRFFRRSLDRKRVFRCRGNKDCSLANILMCAYCRHKRCLAVGMSRLAIKTGRYSHEKRSENIQEVRKRKMALVSTTLSKEEVQSIVGRVAEAYCHVVSNLDVPLAEMEEKGRKKLEEFKLHSEMFGHQYTLSDAQYHDIYTSTGIDVDGRRQHGRFVAKSVEFFVYGFVKFSKGVPGFATLPLQDQAALLKEGWMDVWFLAAHRGFHEQLQIFFAPNKDCQTRAELCRSFGITWVDGSFQLSRRLQKLDLTSHEVMVLSAACLLSSDRCELNAAKQVDDIQWSLINCLLHLLRHSHGACAPLVLARVVACMAEMRSVTNETKKALMATHFTDIIQNHPILADILD